MQKNGSLILVPSLRFFYFCLFFLSNFDVTFLVLWYSILFCCIFLLYVCNILLEACLFSNERQKESGSGWYESWGATGRNRGKTHIIYNKDIVNEKKIIFSKREEKEIF